MIVKDIKRSLRAITCLSSKFENKPLFFVINYIILYITNILYNLLIHVAYFRDSPVMFPV